MVSSTAITHPQPKDPNLPFDHDAINPHSTLGQVRAFTPVAYQQFGPNLYLYKLIGTDGQPAPFMYFVVKGGLPGKEANIDIEGNADTEQGGFITFLQGSKEDNNIYGQILAGKYDAGKFPLMLDAGFMDVEGVSVTAGLGSRVLWNFAFDWDTVQPVIRDNNNNMVLSSTELGPNVTLSSLERLGVLNELNVEGQVYFQMLDYGVTPFALYYDLNTAKVTWANAGGGTPDVTPITLDPAQGRIGINNPLPQYELDVQGAARITNGMEVQNGIQTSSLDITSLNPGEGLIVSSDIIQFLGLQENLNSSGLLSYDPTSGDVDYIPKSSLVVTPDVLPLTLDKANSRVGINNTSPQYALDVNGGGINIPLINAYRIATQNGLSFQASDWSTVAVGPTAAVASTSTNSVVIGKGAGAGLYTVSIGNLAGSASQGGNSVAVGVNAGATSQGGNAVAVGVGAGQKTQLANAVSVGALSGFENQGNGAVAVGNNAGKYSQGASSVAIGQSAGQGTTTAGTGQAADAIAIGRLAGNLSQGERSVAIGYSAGSSSQGSNSVAIGTQSGSSGQLSSAVAVGIQAGQTNQGLRGVAMGYFAGSSNQGTEGVAIGLQAAQTGQLTRGIAIGVSAGNTTQGSNAVAIGTSAGANSQGAGSVAVGQLAGTGTTTAGTAQGTNAVAIGNNAGNTTQGNSAVSVGWNAGSSSQSSNSVAVGNSSGQTTQGATSVAVGYFAGQTSQGANCTAVGGGAGRNTQGTGATAIGLGAGGTTQGASAVAIGSFAGETNQHANSIIVNGTGSTLNSTSVSSLYVKPIRNLVDTTLPVLSYNATSGEITYGPAASIPSPTEILTANTLTGAIATNNYITMCSTPVSAGTWAITATVVLSGSSQFGGVYSQIMAPGQYAGKQTMVGTLPIVENLSVTVKLPATTVSIRLFYETGTASHSNQTELRLVKIA